MELDPGLDGAESAPQQHQLLQGPNGYVPPNNAALKNLLRSNVQGKQILHKVGSLQKRSTHRKIWRERVFELDWLKFAYTYPKSNIKRVYTLNSQCLAKPCQVDGSMALRLDLYASDNKVHESMLLRPCPSGDEAQDTVVLDSWILALQAAMQLAHRSLANSIANSPAASAPGSRAPSAPGSRVGSPFKARSSKSAGHSGPGSARTSAFPSFAGEDEYAVDDHLVVAGTLSYSTAYSGSLEATHHESSDVQAAVRRALAQAETQHREDLKAAEARLWGEHQAAVLAVVRQQQETLKAKNDELEHLRNTAAGGRPYPKSAGNSPFRGGGKLSRRSAASAGAGADAGASPAEAEKQRQEAVATEAAVATIGRRQALTAKSAGSSPSVMGGGRHSRAQQLSLGSHEQAMRDQAAGRGGGQDGAAESAEWEAQVQEHHLSISGPMPLPALHKSGVLRKRRRFRGGWPRRVFELEGTVISYTYPNTNLKRTFQLSPACSVRPATSGLSSRPCLRLLLASNGSRESMLLRPTDIWHDSNLALERDEWVRALEAAIARSAVLPAGGAGEALHHWSATSTAGAGMRGAALESGMSTGASSMAGGSPPLALSGAASQATSRASSAPGTRRNSANSIVGLPATVGVGGEGADGGGQGDGWEEAAALRRTVLELQASEAAAGAAKEAAAKETEQATAAMARAHKSELRAVESREKQRANAAVAETLRSYEQDYVVAIAAAVRTREEEHQAALRALEQRSERRTEAAVEAALKAKTAKAKAKEAQVAAREAAEAQQVAQAQAKAAEAAKAGDAEAGAGAVQEAEAGPVAKAAAMEPTAAAAGTALFDGSDYDGDDGDDDGGDDDDDDDNDDNDYDDDGDGNDGDGELSIDQGAFVDGQRLSLGKNGGGEAAAEQWSSSGEAVGSSWRGHKRGTSAPPSPMSPMSPAAAPTDAAQTSLSPPVIPRLDSSRFSEMGAETEDDASEKENPLPVRRGSASAPFAGLKKGNTWSNARKVFGARGNQQQKQKQKQKQATTQLSVGDYQVL
jgi:hypothetical protein